MGITFQTTLLLVTSQVACTHLSCFFLLFRAANFFTFTLALIIFKFSYPIADSILSLTRNKSARRLLNLSMLS
jgi:hypothetical protein